MFKVFAFLKRNTGLLTHDEYRAGHVGFHCGNTRRLKEIRGYCVNIHDNNVGLRKKLGSLHRQITWNEPDNFLDLWDGFPEIYFDDQTSWTQATTPEPTRASAEGLTIDPDWTMADGPDLFDPAPGRKKEFRSYHIQMDEHLIVPVERREYRSVKLIQFFKRNQFIPDDKFRSAVLGRYSELTSRMAGLRGYTVNFQNPDPDSAIRGFYPPDAWCFSEEGKIFRRKFCEQWDGACELFFDSLEDFLSARIDTELQLELSAREKHLFEAVWYVEVDENIIVMPNREPAPDFYYR